MERSSFGIRLKELREEANYSQKELAPLLNVSVNTISSYERGLIHPSDQTKIKIMEVFNVTMDYLLGVSDLKSCTSENDVIDLPSGLSRRAQRDIRFVIEFILDKERKGFYK